MTGLEIIDETVEYYKNNDRAVDEDGDCQYYLDGKMCAVGRCFIYPKGFEETLCSISALGYLEEQFKEQYRGQDVFFWSELQDLHDADHFWDGHELTTKGENKVNELRSKYGD